MWSALYTIIKEGKRDVHCKIVFFKISYMCFIPEGIRGLYGGLTTTFYAAAPVGALYFTAYEYVKEAVSILG